MDESKTESGTGAHLKALYPFLHQETRKSEDVDDALVWSVAAKARDHLTVFEKFFIANGEALVAASKAVAKTYRTGGRVLTMGNGGSSCDAAHVAVEFQHPVTAGRPALPAINLTADVAMMTAVGNDVGVDHIYVRQLLAHGSAGDCLIGLSTSGNSGNLTRAFKKARELGITTIGFAGMSGGEMKALGLDHCLVVDTDSIHRIQEVHVATYHILWDLVHTLLADDRGSAAGPKKAQRQENLGEETFIDERVVVSGNCVTS